MKENISDYYVSRKSMNKPIYYAGVDGTSLLIVVFGGVLLIVVFTLMTKMIMVGGVLLPLYVVGCIRFLSTRYGKQVKEKKIEDPLSRDLELTMSVKEFRDQDNIMRKL